MRYNNGIVNSQNEGMQCRNSVKKKNKKKKKKNPNFERKNSYRSPSYRISATIEQDTTIKYLMYKSMMQPSSEIVLQGDAWV